VDIGATEFYVSLSVNDVSATEGGINGTDFVFEVSLNASLNQVVTVNYATVNDSAIAGSDYVSTSGTLTFNPGETTKNVTVKVLGDDIVEPDERFFLSLSNSQNALISDGTGQGIIINDNFIKPTISINDVVVDEGNTGRKDAFFTITLSEPTTVPVRVSYGLEDGSAIVGNDYLASQGEVVFQPSETSKNISIGILGDTDIENNETFSVKLSNPVNGTLNKGIGTGTITNDDSIIDDGNNNGNNDNNNGNDGNNNGNDDNNNNNNNGISGDLLINRFQNTARRGTYLFAGEQESANIRRNFRNFAEEGAAFRVFSQPGDDLIRINRFQNSNVPGTYLYANEQESVSIRRNFPNFIEEGIAFYAYGADANKGSDFYRFQNTQQPGTYIFVGEAEKNSIIANFPQFRLEGIAFEVG